MSQSFNIHAATIIIFAIIFDDIDPSFLTELSKRHPTLPNRPDYLVAHFDCLLADYMGYLLRHSLRETINLILKTSYGFHLVEYLGLYALFKPLKHIYGS